MAPDPSGAHAPPAGRPGARLSRLLLAIAASGAAVYCAFWAIWTANRLGDERDRARAAVHRSLDQAAQGFGGFVGAMVEANHEAAAAFDPASLAKPDCAALPPGPTGGDGKPIGRTDLVANGVVVCSTAGRADDTGAPWLAPAYEPGTPTADYVDPATGRSVWGAASPVGGSGSGLLATIVELGPAGDQLTALYDDGTGTRFMVWNEDTGRLLSRPRGTSWTPGDAAGLIVDSQKLPGTPWRLAAAVPRSVADEVVWSQARAAGLALLAAMAALAFTALLVLRRIVRPLEAVTTAAREAAGGGTSDLPATGPAEIAQLATALNDLTASRADREEQLRQSAYDLAHAVERLDAVLANCADMILIVDRAGRIAFASPSVAAVCGPSARAGVRFTSLVHPEDTAAASILVGPGQTARDATAQLRMGGGAAGWRFVELVARDLSADDAVQGVVLNGRDVTDRLAEAAERAVLDDRLHQSQRLESLGALAGGIAHDFKNLLSVIVWSADMASGHQDGSADQDLGEIRAAASRGIDLAEQLLAFSRQEQPTPEPLDIGAELVELAEMLRRTLGSRLNLDLRVTPRLPCVRIDRSRFHQAVVNLVVNARDAMPDGASPGGRVVLEAVEQDAGPEVGVDPGHYVVVTATDDGAGMTAEVASRALEPFFTTKAPGAGSGLGLSIVHGVVTAAGGAVRIDSAPGRGTTVRLFLPASTDLDVRGEAPAAAAAIAGSGQAVLVVEDDAAVRALVVRMLREGGYSAVDAAGPATALELAARPDVRIDVVLTDLLMPTMSGADLASRLHRVRPELPVIFMSAYSADVLHELVSEGPTSIVLAKPFTPRQLLDAVHAALAASTAGATEGA
ncbi:MAG TPA: ATP-binding protein [Acidimicrobiales bacterium]|nr:ATP-binding protein [Acidimicrobiales bacterium]